MLPEVSEPTGLLLKNFDELNVIFQSSLYYSNPSDFSPSYIYTHFYVFKFSSFCAFVHLISYAYNAASFHSYCSQSCPIKIMMFSFPTSNSFLSPLNLGLTIHIYGIKYFIIFYYNILTIFSSYVHKQVNVK